MWLPAAKKMKAREAIPRSEGPFVSIKKRKDQRWQVYVRLDDGRSGSTTCKTHADAKDLIAENTGTSQLSGQMLSIAESNSAIPWMAVTRYINSRTSVALVTCK